MDFPHKGPIIWKTFQRRHHAIVFIDLDFHLTFRQGIRQRALDYINDEVYPVMRKLKTFLEEVSFTRKSLIVL